MRLAVYLAASFVAYGRILHAQAASETAGRLQPSVEATSFERAEASVFRVESGLGHGSGFLVDNTGLLVTNDHVVSVSDTSVTIYFDSTTRVPGRVVLRSADADLAILRVDLRLCPRCTSLEIDSGASKNLRPGDRILAFGYPLSQPLTITTGIVASLRPAGIITDALLNPGNSGGPLLNADGKVVGVATFIDAGDISSPGLGGGVNASLLPPLLDQARKLEIGKAAPTGRLPTVPLARYPLSLLKAVADTTNENFYDQLEDVGTGPFQVSISTPLSQMIRQVRTGRVVTRFRRKREEKANIPPGQRYSDLNQLRDWVEYIGDVNVPVVAFSIVPKVRESSGSSILRAISVALVGVSGGATMQFAGDVQGFVLRQNGEVITPLRGGHAPVRAHTGTPWATIQDVADYGYYLYPPEVFRPDSTGLPPTITIEVADLGRPGSPRTATLSQFAVARTWNDFEAFYRHQRPEELFASFRFARTCKASPMQVGNADICEYIVQRPSNSPSSRSKVP